MSPIRRFGSVMVLTAMGLLFSMHGLEGEVAASEGQMKMDKVEAGSKTIVLIGASYAGGWPSEKPLAGYRMINKGVSGQQSFEMLARFESDVCALNPDAVIIWGFINDVFRSDRSQIDQTLRRTRESIIAMVELARRTGITPVLATEVTIRGKAGWSERFESMIGRILGKSSYQDYVNGHVIETNRWIRDLATREGVLLLDLETVLADQQSVRRKEFALPDGSHISPQGYEALMRYSEDKIRSAPGSR
ncbi:GDSL-type esterase/lipase family protein [Nitrospira sp. NS4]|uniref:GDSL-type esterase/lipase family protein n=1 Tax=Nitrospira sp. NS4 TaxID=3414498 RepID=UPI003C30B64A